MEISEKTYERLKKDALLSKAIRAAGRKTGVYHLTRPSNTVVITVEYATPEQKKAMEAGFAAAFS